MAETTCKYSEVDGILYFYLKSYFHLSDPALNSLSDPALNSTNNYDMCVDSSLLTLFSGFFFTPLINYNIYIIHYLFAISSMSRLLI